MHDTSKHSWLNVRGQCFCIFAYDKKRDNVEICADRGQTVMTEFPYILSTTLATRISFDVSVTDLLLFTIQTRKTKFHHEMRFDHNFPCNKYLGDNRRSHFWCDIIGATSTWMLQLVTCSWIQNFQHLVIRFYGGLVRWKSSTVKCTGFLIMPERP